MSKRSEATFRRGKTSSLDQYSPRKAVLLSSFSRPVVEGQVAAIKQKRQPQGLAFCLSGKRGSDPRPQPWQGCALPTELFPQIGNANIRQFFNIPNFSTFFCCCGAGGAFFNLFPSKMACFARVSVSGCPSRRPRCVPALCAPARPARNRGIISIFVSSARGKRAKRKQPRQKPPDAKRNLNNGRTCPQRP